jgi:hypothetical protein
MKHIDYWIDIEYGQYIILDDELPLEKIKFEEGDLLQVCKTTSGAVMLKKVDPLTKFTLGFPRLDDNSQ